MCKDFVFLLTKMWTGYFPLKMHRCKSGYGACSSLARLSAYINFKILCNPKKSTPHNTISLNSFLLRSVKVNEPGALINAILNKNVPPKGAESERERGEKRRRVRFT